MIFLNVLFVIICLFLMLSILLQSGKGEGLSGTFGGSSQFMGGRAAATFLTKTTTALAAAFMLLCVIISILGKSAISVPEGQSEAQRRLSETAPAQSAPAQQGAPAQSAPGQQGAPAQQGGPGQQAPAGAPQGQPAPATTPGGPQ